VGHLGLRIASPAIEVFPPLRIQHDLDDRIQEARVYLEGAIEQISEEERMAYASALWHHSDGMGMGASYLCNKYKYSVIIDSKYDKIELLIGGSVMTPEELKTVQHYAQQIAKILYSDTDPTTIQSLGGIETVVRQKILESVSPEIGVFYRNDHSNDSRQISQAQNNPRDNPNQGTPSSKTEGETSYSNQ